MELPIVGSALLLDGEPALLDLSVQQRLGVDVYGANELRIGMVLVTHLEDEGGSEVAHFHAVVLVPLRVQTVQDHTMCVCGGGGKPTNHLASSPTRPPHSSLFRSNRPRLCQLCLPELDVDERVGDVLLIHQLGDPPLHVREVARLPDGDDQVAVQERMALRVIKQGNQDLLPIKK